MNKLASFAQDQITGEIKSVPVNYVKAGLLGGGFILMGWTLIGLAVLGSILLWAYLKRNNTSVEDEYRRECMRERFRQRV